jgi:Predicted periplasmic solute-binding protein
MTIRLGHSPDADDAFMFWALAEGLVDTPLQFEHVLRDIQTLNEWAREGKLEFTALSVHNRRMSPTAMWC